MEALKTVVGDWTAYHVVGAALVVYGCIAEGRSDLVFWGLTLFFVISEEDKEKT